MRATLNDFKVIFLWSIVAFLLVTIVGSFLFYLTGFSVLLIPVIAAGAVVYSFCSFKAANQLKSKTQLSWLSIAVLYMGFLLLYGIILPHLLGYGRGSANIVGLTAAFIGAYVSHKTSSSLKRKKNG